MNRYSNPRSIYLTTVLQLLENVQVYLWVDPQTCVKDSGASVKWIKDEFVYYAELSGMSQHYIEVICVDFKKLGFQEIILLKSLTLLMAFAGNPYHSHQIRCVVQGKNFFVDESLGLFKALQKYNSPLADSNHRPPHYE